MAILEILSYPHPILREKCLPVAEITPDIRQLLDDMAETMYDAPGLGLAAPQIGSNLRLIVLDVENDEETNTRPNLYQLANPEIIAFAGSAEGEEGCLSLPGIRENVKRYERVTVRALDKCGRSITIEADGLLAICLQHEIDHLNGVLIIDHLSRLKRELAKSKMKKLSERP